VALASASVPFTAAAAGVVRWADVAEGAGIPAQTAKWWKGTPPRTYLAATTCIGGFFQVPFRTASPGM
jgi:hypothetical protein